MILACIALLPLLCIPLTYGGKGIRRSLWLLVVAAVFSFVCASAVLVIWPREGVLRFAGGLFVADASSRLFLGLISAVFTGVALYVYNRALLHPLATRNIQSFVRNALLFFSVSALAVLCHHLILMWVLIEASALVAVPLIYHQRGRASVAGAWKYVLFSSFGLGIAFLGFVLIGVGLSGHAEGASVSWYFDQIPLGSPGAPLSTWKELGLLLVLFGFGTKLGLAPMYSWLPDTYDSAPPSVTVLLSAVQFNVVILAVFRVFQYLNPLQSEKVRLFLIGIGMLSLLTSAFHIILAKNYKRLIAYASINHAGVIALGLGLGREAAYGVVLYVLSNALVKAVLFLTCGNIKARYHTKSIADLQGLIRTMPFSGAFFMVGIFALLGFAPFGSFFGEVLIMKSMVEGRHYVVFAVFCMITTLVFMATGRATFPMIWGDSTREVSLRGESVYTLLPNLFYLFLLLTLGIYLPASANALLQNIAAGLGGR